LAVRMAVRWETATVVILRDCGVTIKGDRHDGRS
jgi:hypothetical protein